MLQVYKMVNDMDRMDPSLFFSMVIWSSTRGHSQKMVKSQARLGTRQNVLSQSIVNDWNSIPAHVVESPTLNTFKSQLDKFWKEERL